MAVYIYEEPIERMPLMRLRGFNWSWFWSSWDNTGGISFGFEEKFPQEERENNVILFIWSPGFWGFII
tara:strand:- start:104 stop:307 length:204 start_codon:yes stop_codon:yes gene_type:complete